jgi:crotonobetainyl-CoA:carnitine CoA-transferase CaiB-like acyl-CoA transferase
MALFDSVATLSCHQAATYFQSGTVPQRLGNSSSGIMTPYETFKCADGYLVIAVGNDTQWRALCTAIGRDDLAQDQRFNSPAGRSGNKPLIVAELSRTFAMMKVGALQAKLDEAGVANGPINDLEQVFSMEQARERGIKVSLPRSDGVEVPCVASPIRMSATPVQYRSAAPKLGEHRDDVLDEWLRADASSVEAWRAGGAFGK